MEEVQRQQERLKQELKTMLPIQRMQKGHDSKSLKQQYNSLKEREESLATRLEPLQVAATILSQVLTDKRTALASIIEETKADLKETMSEKMVVEL